MDHPRTLALLPDTFAVCRLDPTAAIPAWASSGNFTAITRTPDELSIVCAQTSVPAGITAERNWRCLKVVGPLDFALTGILAALAVPLAQAGISIFAISTYDTDYLLVQAAHLAQALTVLREAGWIVVVSVV